MCGIAGIYGRTEVDREVLIDMAGELAHRGPDGVGVYMDQYFGMVNMRLSIIDLEGGDQPLGNETNRYWAMQNGEIYNYIELRDELSRLGHLFSTHSDTEVIVHAYEEWGEAFLDRLNGEFVLALYDHRTKRLLLARDRFGIRPLFIGTFGGQFAFASEAKALLRHPAAYREIDPYALVETFTLWANQPDRSAFSGISELPAGHYMWVDEDGPGEQRRWWDIRFGPREGTRRESVEALQEELLELLSDATRIRLRADVPVGVYLSGGLDSSATTSLARRHARGPLEAFSVAFDDPRFDESAYQDRVAAELGVNLHRITVSDAEVASVLPEVIRYAEKPMLRTAPAPLLLLSRFVRSLGTKVVLTGEGADELFGGYNIFQEAMVRRFWARDPDSKLRPRLLGKLYPYLSRDLIQGGGFMAEFFRHGMQDLQDPLYSHRPRISTTSRNLKFLSAEALGSRSALGDPEQRLIERLPHDFQSMGPLGQAQYVEIASFLTGFLLHSQGDRMLMGNSVEGRFPFLDVNVAEFAASLPERLRLRDIQEKYLLRKSLRDVVPDEINRRPKRPYRAPILKAFFGPGAPEYVATLLSSERVTSTGLFNGESVARLAAKASKYVDIGLSESDEMGLVGVLSTMLLHDAFVAAPELAAPAVPTRLVRGSTVELDRGVSVQ